MNVFPSNNTDEYVKKQTKKMLDEFVPLLREFIESPDHTKPNARIELHANRMEDIWYVKKNMEKRGSSRVFGMACAPMDMIRTLVELLLEAGFYMFYVRSEQIVYVQARNICPQNMPQLTVLNYKSLLE
jgi:hypothetical protein